MSIHFIICFIYCPVAQSCTTLCDTMKCNMPGFPVLHYLLEFAQTQVHWVGDDTQPSHLLLSPSPPSLNLSQHQDNFQWVHPSHQVAKVFKLQLQHQCFQWTFRIDLLAVQVTLRSLFQHHSSKASILWCSAFFIVQHSHPHITAGKTIALTRWTFVGKVVSLLFNMLLAKSLQLCPTLCDPIDSSPPGSPIPGILQARTLEWVSISFSNAWKWKVKVKSLSHVRLLATPWTAAYQVPPSMGFPRQEYWSGLPLPSLVLNKSQSPVILKIWNNMGLISWSLVTRSHVPHSAARKINTLKETDFSLEKF